MMQRHPVSRYRFHGLSPLLLGLLVNISVKAADAPLRIYWTDVEGGAATLIVTPAGETILIDTGLPGERDPGRIAHTVRERAGAERIDHLVVTHFDTDHYGGTADLAKLVPIGRVYDPGLPRDPSAGLGRGLVAYLDAVAERRTVIRPGDVLPLRAAATSGTRLSIRCLASYQEFLAANRQEEAPTPAVCAQHETRGKDMSQNANSVVLLVQFGAFRFLDAADLTWELEKKLVCPYNLVGQVDVFQVDHHGLAESNNPVLVEAIAPRVAIINNGHRKGAAPATLATLRKVSTIDAIYQLHRNLGVDDSVNTSAHRIANEAQKCDANVVTLEVSPNGKRYQVSVPAKGTSESYAVWSQE